MRTPMTVSTPLRPAFLCRVCIGILLLLTFLTTASAASAAPALSTASLAEVTQQQYEDEQDLRPRATKPFLLRVMPLGASITVGYRSSDGNGYRKYLREQLRYAGWGVDMVGSLANGTMKDNQNEGHFGDTIDHIAEAAVNSTRLQPNVILINAGTNDCIQDIEITDADTRLDSLITHLFASIPNTTIILSTLLPNEFASRAVRRVSQEYRNLVARRRSRGDRLVLAEMSYFITDDQLADGTHPSDTGYKMMAAVWWSAIQTAEEEGKLSAPNIVTKSVLKDLVGVNGTAQTEGKGLDDGPVEDPQLPEYNAPGQPGGSGGEGGAVALGYGLRGKLGWGLVGLWIVLTGLLE
ncbi:SGNH/GDSL hydrolase family protein [Aspergillus foveolatus]|uniref:SGNH/GDSL hydrolase family protein n=1 Tax=Aspergillus foveolatus TaxID=210207 RepID=UPI003CCDB943